MIVAAAVPFTDLGAAYRRLRPALDTALARVVASGWYIGGPEVGAFEEAFAAAAGAAHAVGVANGTDAITLALRALGVGAGDEVVVPAVSAYPTTVGIVRAGAVPAFVDVDASGLLDPAAVAAALTPRVRAVVCVHLYGNCAPGAALAALCERHGLVLVEDCAQAHGAARDGRPAGSWGHAAAWSFYPTKNLGALGDAGAVTCADGEVAARLRRARNYGQRNRYEHSEWGINSRLDPVQAAVLAVKLPHLAADNQRRRAVAARYDEAFAGAAVQPIPVPPGCLPNRHLYPVLLRSGDERQALQVTLNAAGVETLIHYPIPMPDQPASEPVWSGGRAFPAARALCGRVLSLPVYPELSDAQVGTVIAAVSGWGGPRAT